MPFIRLVEVFPPVFPAAGRGARRIDPEGGIKDFVEGVRTVRDLADIFLVADVKDTKLLKLSTLEAATILKERLGVEAAPVIVVRDLNRQRFLSTVLTGISLGLKAMMIAWGDRYPSGEGSTNVRDFTGLAGALRRASSIRERTRSSTLLLAPVDLDRLVTKGGVRFAKERLRAGADFLLAQPPTTDSGAVFEAHSRLLTESGLKDRVFLNVFPFRDADDVRECERRFGWRLPPSQRRKGAGRGSSLLDAGRGVAPRLRAEGFPGVYVSTRGNPGVAERLLL